MSNLRVKAIEGRLLPDTSVGGLQRKFVGWRPVHVDGQGAPVERAQHIIPGAPGVTHVNEKGAPVQQTADLFVAGREVRLTRFERDGITPLIEEVPDNTYFRTAIRVGDIELVDAE